MFYLNVFLNIFLKVKINMSLSIDSVTSLCKKLSNLTLGESIILLLLFVVLFMITNKVMYMKNRVQQRYRKRGDPFSDLAQN
jgi:hypothetical protein